MTFFQLQTKLVLLQTKYSCIENLIIRSTILVDIYQDFLLNPKSKSTITTR